MITAEDTQRFYRIIASVNSVFEKFHSRFFGRNGLQVRWGGFDNAELLFTGKHLKAPYDRGFIMHYDLEAEHMNACFWPGYDKNPSAGFYGYLFPRPAGCEIAPIGCGQVSRAGRGLALLQCGRYYGQQHCAKAML